MTTPGRPFRVGDAERDSAASALGEHYAAGRLTKAEYDERLEGAWAARYNTELRELFADLPGPAGQEVDARSMAPQSEQRPQQASGWPSSVRGAHPLLLVPVILGIGAVLVVAVYGAPWLLFVAFWLFMCCGGFGRGRATHTHRRGLRQHRHA